MVACCLVALLAGCREEATSAQVCATPRPDIAASRPEGVIVAGTGAGLSPLKMLARAYAEQTDDPKERVFIPVSIGTGGGLRALAAGAIDLAITARPLEQKEREKGFEEHRLATSRVVFVTRREELERLDRATLLAIYRGEQRVWSDGRPITPLFRERGDSSLKLLRSHDPELGEALMPPERDTRRGLVLHTDQQMRDALLEIDGAIGWLHVGMIRTETLPLHPLEVLIEEDRLLEIELPIYLVEAKDKGERREAIERFLRFATSEQARHMLEGHGYRTP